MLVAKAEVKTFERLFHAHHRAVLGYALRRVEVAAAQDIVAETFLIAWRRRLDIPAAAELPWLLGVARNVTRQHHKGGVRDAALATELVRLQAFRPVDTDDLAGEVSERLVVLQALADLSEMDREVLVLTAWDHLSNKDAARVLGCSGAAFRVRLHRARTRLKLTLAHIDGTGQSPATATPQLTPPVEILPTTPTTTAIPPASQDSRHGRTAP